MGPKQDPKKKKAPCHNADVFPLLGTKLVHSQALPCPGASLNFQFITKRGFISF